jgi:hypothetical protein
MKKAFLIKSSTILFVVAVLGLIGCAQPTDYSISEKGTVLPAPKNVKATPAPGGILVSWDPVKDAASYTVYRKDVTKDDLGISEKVGSGVSNPYYADIVGYSNYLVDGHEYQYTVVSSYSSSPAEIVLNGSAVSKKVVAQVPATSPVKPATNVTVTQEGANAVVHWDSANAASEPNFTTYTARYTAADGTFAYITTGPTSATGADGGLSKFFATKHAATFALVGGDTTVTVTATWTGAGSYYPSVESAGTSAPSSIAALAVVTGVTAARSDAVDQSKVVVKWNIVPGATGYDVYRADYASGTEISGWESLGSATNPEYVDGTTDYIKDYRYVIIAKNADARSSSISAGGVVTGFDTSFSLTGDPISNFVAQWKSAGENDIVLTWRSVAGATDYEVKRAEYNAAVASSAGPQSLNLLYINLGAWTPVNISAKTVNASGSNYVNYRVIDPVTDNTKDYVYTIVALNGTLQTPATITQGYLLQNRATATLNVLTVTNSNYAISWTTTEGITYTVEKATATGVDHDSNYAGDFAGYDFASGGPGTGPFIGVYDGIDSPSISKVQITGQWTAVLFDNLANQASFTAEIPNDSDYVYRFRVTNLEGLTSAYTYIGLNKVTGLWTAGSGSSSYSTLAQTLDQATTVNSSTGIGIFRLEFAKTTGTIYTVTRNVLTDNGATFADDDRYVVAAVPATVTLTEKPATTAQYAVYIDDGATGPAVRNLYQYKVTAKVGAADATVVYIANVDYRDTLSGARIQSVTASSGPAPYAIDVQLGSLSSYTADLKADIWRAETTANGVNYPYTTGWTKLTAAPVLIDSLPGFVYTDPLAYTDLGKTYTYYADIFTFSGATNTLVQTIAQYGGGGQYPSYTLQNAYDHIANSDFNVQNTSSGTAGSRQFVLRSTSPVAWNGTVLNPNVWDRFNGAHLYWAYSDDSGVTYTVSDAGSITVASADVTQSSTLAALDKGDYYIAFSESSLLTTFKAGAPAAIDGGRNVYLLYEDDNDAGPTSIFNKGNVSGITFYVDPTVTSLSW